MSQDLAHRKRVQAGLSVTAAAAGLAALGTKGGAVGARQVLARTPKAARVLRLTPKGAEKADKASLGLVTVGSGVGGASGLNFAALQRAEAKKEEVGKSVIDMESKRREADLRRAKINGQRQYRKDIEAGRFLKVGEEREFGTRTGPDGKPKHIALGVRQTDEHHSTPQRHLIARRQVLAPAPRTKPGGINPEGRRQRRMKLEEIGATGAAVAAGGLTAGYARNAVQNSANARKSDKRTIRLERKSRNNELMAWNNNANKNKPAAAANAARALSYHKAAGRSNKTTKLLRAGSRARTKQAIGAGVATAGLTAAAAGIHHMRRNQGKSYSDWWDG